MCPQDWISQLAFSTQQTPKEVCSNASEEIDFLARLKQAGKKNNLFQKIYVCC